MVNFVPFRGFYPNRYYHYYNHYSTSNFPLRNDINIEEPAQKKDEKIYEVNKQKKSSRHNSFGSIRFSNIFSNDLENPIVEILGIQLYLDDLIILGLLFFLYQENVQDEVLFFILILLLLS